MPGANDDAIGLIDRALARDAPRSAAFRGLVSWRNAIVAGRAVAGR